MTPVSTTIKKKATAWRNGLILCNPDNGRAFILTVKSGSVCFIVVCVDSGPGPARSASSSGCRHGADDGVAVRVFYVFSGGAHHRSVGPGTLPHSAPQESPLPGRDGPLPPGVALQGWWGDANRERPR